MTEKLEPPSELFEDAVSTGGSIVTTCDFCGRTHFEDSEQAGDWEDDELGRLRAEAKENPDKTIAGTGVRSGMINGQLAVIGCPCNSLRKFENWIWSHRRIIATYLTARSVEEKQVADLGHALMGELVNAVPF